MMFSLNSRQAAKGRDRPRYMVFEVLGTSGCLHWQQSTASFKSALPFDRGRDQLNERGQPWGMTEEGPKLITESMLTCPKCGHQATETMPTDGYQFFYDCKGCGERLKPLPGECCVFCSYGSVPCPPIQANASCFSPLCRCKTLTRWPSSTIVRPMNGHNDIFGICREIIR